MGSRLPTTNPARMPLPDYGHHNAEKKTHQDMVFEMAPEIVSDDDSMEVVNGKKVKRKRGKITTGKLGIDLERTMVIHDEKISRETFGLPWILSYQVGRWGRFEGRGGRQL